MLKLMKLELAKNKLSTYLWACLGIFIFGFGFCFLTAYIPQLEQLDGAMPSSVDITMFGNWGNFISLISILFVAAFSVLSAVMHTKFTVEEYTGKRAVLLFSYPQSRSKILFAKCSLVFLFTVIGVMVCNLLAIGMFAAISNTFGIMPKLFTASSMPELLTTTGISALLAASVGLVSVRVGFWRKSMVATVVTSFLLIAPFGNILSLFPQYANTARLIGMGVTLIIGLIIFTGLLSKVHKMEAL